MPHLLASPNRENIIWVIVHNLRSSKAGLAPNSKIRWPASLPALDLPARPWFDHDPQGKLMSIAVATSLLKSILIGPDANLKDSAQFIAGYEDAILEASQCATRFVGNGDDNTAARDLIMTAALLDHLRVYNCGRTRQIREYSTVHMVLLSTTTRQLGVGPGRVQLDYIIHRIQATRLAHTCAAPGCQSPIGRTDFSTVLRKCSTCTTVKYCSRDCQKSHWKAHKPVCRILAGFANADDMHQYHMVYSDISDRDRRLLAHWSCFVPFKPSNELANGELVSLFDAY